MGSLAEEGERMFQIKKIVFPVDFSESCLGASRYVEAYAGRFQAELTLVHVVDVGAYAALGTSALEFVPGNDLRKEAGDRARDRMATFLQDELKHFDVTRKVLEGDPSRQIIAEAHQSGADLIMMPTHGLSIFRRYILGSVTAKVLHDAECAVWTGVHLEGAPQLEEIAFRRVLCAVDMGPQTEKAIRWAASFAAEHSAELLVTHIVAASDARPAKYFDQRFVADVSAQVEVDLRALLEKLSIKARVIVGAGDPAKALSEILSSEKVDQLVIARGAVAEGFGRLRSHAYSLIRSSPCPVLSV